MKIELEMLSSASNAPVIIAPGRVYPGMVIQGDTLFGFYSRAKKALAVIDKDKYRSEYDSLEVLKDSLEGLLEVYEATLNENGMSLPY